jgi:hypothetical protein
MNTETGNSLDHNTTPPCATGLAPSGHEPRPGGQIDIEHQSCFANRRLQWESFLADFLTG